MIILALLSIYYTFKFNSNQIRKDSFYRIKIDPTIKHIVINLIFQSNDPFRKYLDCIIFFFIHLNPSLLFHHYDYRSLCYDQWRVCLIDLYELCTVIYYNKSCVIHRETRKFSILKHLFHEGSICTWWNSLYNLTVWWAHGATTV